MKKRFLIKIEGTVQGIGFRPFVYRIAKENKLNGFVKNNPEGVTIEVEGEVKNLNKFLSKLKRDKPPLTTYTLFEIKEIPLKNENEFEILKSEEKGEKIALILPDIATCEECKREIFDKKNRRYFYPFTNCTNCGPRFSIIQNIPYDRKNTTMKIFEMCPECKEEYENPINRRFHAQPNACPECGPEVFLTDREGNIIEKGEKAIEKTAQFLKKGKIIALKGIGGFQLLTNALSDECVLELRKRKKRDEKPFAIMFKNLEHLKEYAYISSIEKEILLSPQSPILIIKSKKDNKLSKYCAPDNPYIGAILPYTPLHHLLMSKIDFPIICTSGNLSEEPIAYENEEALIRLKDIADYFLMNTRPIERYIDDSVVKIINNKPLVIRRARGYAPLPFIIKKNLPQILALGPYLKNTIAISKFNRIIVSQHIGDLDNEKSFNAFKKVIEDFKKLYEFKPEIIACDAHPEYLSTKYGEELSKNENIPLIKVFHHHAHIASCMIENRIEEEVLGVSWDGTGYGRDGKIWGGEFLICDFKDFKRFASFREFGLLGGDKAIKEPRRSAIGILYEIYGEKIFEMDFEPIKSLTEEEKKIFKSAYEKNLSIFKTTSAGRIFDAVSSLLNLKQKSTFEGQAAMILEWIAENYKGKLKSPYTFEIKKENYYVIDFVPIFEEIISDIKRKKDKSYIAYKFHLTLVEIVKKISQLIDKDKILLSGGVFQNKLLTELIFKKIKNKKIFIHSQIPPNDGGISIGQIKISYHNL
ncbi:MAG: carbamoyltransferase HypF [candidate division WOR-3 bacterium]